MALRKLKIETAFLSWFEIRLCAVVLDIAKTLKQGYKNNALAESLHKFHFT